ncbi:DUF5683 domain-containing protein [Maribellus maritimus]|uniref:DUF5683 domain-containing protein n=1 Tax=Maribellus maritimus TaxID=2870838 RepID=UPI001EEACFFB|nr:DUF5683 domain-containing protein [Maribellus maritimus]MCG6186659.1 hypothetical protein [Maribellus maritimus]
MNFKSALQKFFIFCLLLLAEQTVIGQGLVEADTVATVTQKPIEEEKVHSPKRATLYSAILPGLGQAYNKKYWKIPFVYIGFGTIGYFIDWNNDYYQLTKRAYIHLRDDDPETTDYLKLRGIEYYDLENATDKANLETALSKRQEYYRRNRDFLIISMVAFYGLNIIDASVDAHLFNFDVSDDLSLNWQPSMLHFQNDLVYCINLTFNF